MSDKKTILVIDDEPDIVTFVSTVLEDAGYAVLTAADGEEALQKVRARAPDLITLDISMPQKSGVRFYRDLRENQATAAIPVIIVTGISGEFEKFISTRRQVPPPQGYIQKPIEPKALLDLVAKVLEK